MADPDHVIPAVVFIIPDKDIQFLVECNVVDISQAMRENVQVTAIGATTQDSSLLKDQAVTFRADHIASPISECQVEPTIMARHNPVGTMQSVGIVLGGQSESGEEILSQLGNTVTIGVSQ